MKVDFGVSPAATRLAHPRVAVPTTRGSLAAMRPPCLPKWLVSAHGSISHPTCSTPTSGDSAPAIGRRARRSPTHYLVLTGLRRGRATRTTRPASSSTKRSGLPGRAEFSGDDPLPATGQRSRVATPTVGRDRDRYRGGLRGRRNGSGVRVASSAGGGPSQINVSGARSTSPGQTIVP